MNGKAKELEKYNFHVNSDGWKKFSEHSYSTGYDKKFCKEYLENPEGDIWEILQDGDCRSYAI